MIVHPVVLRSPVVSPSTSRPLGLRHRHGPRHSAGEQLALVALSLILAATGARAASLPLQEGAYTSSACKDGQVEDAEYIGVYVSTEGRDRGRQYVIPWAEGQDGNCALGRVTVSGHRYTASPRCEAGNRALPSGTYRLAFDVIDRRTFRSRGKTYRWCAESR